MRRAVSRMGAVEKIYGEGALVMRARRASEALYSVRERHLPPIRLAHCRSNPRGHKSVGILTTYSGKALASKVN